MRKPTKEIWYKNDQLLTQLYLQNDLKTTSMNNNFWIKIIYLSIAIISNQIIATAQTSTPVPIPSVSIDVVNYVRIWEPVKPISNIADVIHPNRSTKEVRQTTKYFDAFGRLIQIVEKGASFETNTNTQKDVVNPYLYDDFGRES